MESRRGSKVVTVCSEGLRSHQAYACTASSDEADCILHIEETRDMELVGGRHLIERSMTVFVSCKNRQQETKTCQKSIVANTLVEWSRRNLCQSSQTEEEMPDERGTSRV